LCIYPQGNSYVVLCKVFYLEKKEYGVKMRKKTRNMAKYISTRTSTGRKEKGDAYPSIVREEEEMQISREKIWAEGGGPILKSKGVRNFLKQPHQQRKEKARNE